MTSSPSTSSPEGIPASRSVSLAAGVAPTILDTSGPISPAPFAFYAPDGHCWRMSQGTFLLDSTTSSPTWPRSGMTRNGRAYQRPPLVRLTSDGDSSWLHTPTAKANQSSPSMAKRDKGSWFRDLWPTPRSRDYKDTGANTDWEQVARKGRLAGAVMWPTPKSSPSGPDYARVNREDSGGDDLATSVARETPGQLNPTWVEWLMGFPIGWTDLEH
jgi:hypothetical protein